MTFAENATALSNFSQLDDVIYHVSEIEYHAKNFLSSLREAQRHLDRLHLHFGELKNLTGDANV